MLKFPFCDKVPFVTVAGLIVLTHDMQAQTEAIAPLRPPAVPLVAHDPYFSIWSPADKLNGADTVHWTGKPHRLQSQIRIDGVSYRVMGAEPQDRPALEQKNLRLLPTRTIY